MRSKVKEKGTSYEDIYNKVPLGVDKGKSSLSIWKDSFTPKEISYNTFNRIMNKMYDTGIIKRMVVGASFFYWKENEKFPEDVIIND